ncbi:SMI1/KNR4 family protein [Clavibacter sp. CT19]|uniref:SMI1/KNR4 family protein n=1 Tax=unclassified Clavibacter TaxID=2626594 RepID=UPI0022EA10D7|nr:SMI1/KNR4 family protein [Clavibacter sp. CT19]MDA3804477.1 SMI1/KNR4 family protein [Clavibacter sp. CT19]
MSIIDLAERFFQEPGNEIFCGSPARDGEIRRAEASLGVRFDPDYVRFITAFGGLYVGVSIYGFHNSTMLEALDVASLTKRYRDDGWPGSEDSYVISFDMSGNPIMIGEDAHVFTYDHDSGGYRELAESFSAFVAGALR